jgi:hypothetical protein
MKTLPAEGIEFADIRAVLPGGRSVELDAALPAAIERQSSFLFLPQMGSTPQMSADGVNS